MAKVSIELDELAGTDAAPERRRSQRAQLVVRVDYATVDELFSEFTRDINEGGLFIETEKPRELGSVVSMHFHLPGSDQTVEVRGTVIRTHHGEDGHAAGMGIEFEDLGDETRSQIDQIIRALRTGTPPPSSHR